jgi:DNA uptake protein ComE-like DNA-binding protein
MFPEKSSILSWFNKSVPELFLLLRRKTDFLLGGVGIFLILTAVALNHINSVQNMSTKVGWMTTEGGNVNQSPIISQTMPVVDIEGAVQQPGVYTMPIDSRIQDVLITAGGLTAKADRTTLSDSINLAQRVFDGMKIYIPEAGLDFPQKDLVNINTASENDLDRLPGIGPVTAKKIIAGRPYGRIVDLIDNKIISRSVYDKIKTLISITGSITGKP